MSHTKTLDLRRTLPLVLSLLCALPLAGCGGGGANGGSSSSPSPAPVTPAAPLSASAVTPSGLTATLAESAATVPVGGSATYTLTLTNNTKQSVTFLPVNSGSTPTATAAAAVGGTLTITSRSGAVVYPPQNDGMTTTPGGSIGPPTTLAPGQSAMGTVVTGNVFSASGPYSTSATFTDQQASTTVGPLTVTVQ